jgi:hypothetical protein
LDAVCGQAIKVVSVFAMHRASGHARVQTWFFVPTNEVARQSRWHGLNFVASPFGIEQVAVKIERDEHNDWSKPANQRHIEAGQASSRQMLPSELIPIDLGLAGPVLHGT